MLTLLGRAHSLIVRHASLAAAVLSGAVESDADRWEAVEIQAELDTIEGDLADDDLWRRRWVDGEKEVRVQLGHEVHFVSLPPACSAKNMLINPFGILQFFRAAVRIYVLRAGFQVPSRDERIQACVRSVIRASQQIRECLSLLCQIRIGKLKRLHSCRFRSRAQLAAPCALQLDPSLMLQADP